MKNIEKAANEFADMHGFRVPYDGSNKFYDDTDVKASVDGFKAGVTFAQQWISVDDELPERDSNPSFNHMSENILLKKNSGNIFGGYYDYDMEEFYNDFEEIVFEIIEWRPIELR